MAVGLRQPSEISAASDGISAFSAGVYKRSTWAGLETISSSVMRSGELELGELLPGEQQLASEQPLSPLRARAD